MDYYDFQINSLARFFAPQIIEFYSTEQGQREFEEWRQARQANFTEEMNDREGNERTTHRDNG